MSSIAWPHATAIESIPDKTAACVAWTGRHPSSRSFWWTSAAWPVFDLVEFLGPQHHDVELIDKERPAAVAAVEVG